MSEIFLTSKILPSNNENGESSEVIDENPFDLDDERDIGVNQSNFERNPFGDVPENDKND